MLPPLNDESQRVLFVSTPDVETPAGDVASEGLVPVALAALRPEHLQQAPAAVLNIDLADPQARGTIRAITGQLEKTPPLILAVERGSAFHIQSTQANALGARGVIRRPLERSGIRQTLEKLSIALPPEVSLDRHAGGRSVAAARQLIGASFAALSAGAPLRVEEAAAATRELFYGLGQAGLHNWLDLVRAHHRGTFQHCLLVTGAVVAYAAHAGIGDQARLQLAIAALLHDIGKAEIPNAILDKTGELTAEEFAIIRRHPRIGADYLANQSSLPAVIVEPVLRHHEYLDGSGYPDGVRGGHLNLATRILTVCDIYGALVEERAYKPVMSQPDALYTLIGLAQRGKVDYSVVRTLAAALGTALPATPAGAIQGAAG
jgi:putative nucleotidyltransferase with HDIG domain